MGIACGAGSNGRQLRHVQKQVNQTIAPVNPRLPSLLPTHALLSSNVATENSLVIWPEISQ